MTLERGISRAFLLDNETWMRHANPWSVWTRFTALPVIVFAFWSRVWLGGGSLFLIILSLVWMFLNPRLFRPAMSTDNWASRSVLGERVWMNRDRIPVPDYHRIVPHLLNLISGIGLLGVIWGTLVFDPRSLLTGLAFVYLGKLWFLDRMTWLYQDMQQVPEYGIWLY
jgi:hypothetical protein